MRGEGEGRLKKEGRDVYVQLIQNQSQIPYEYTVEVMSKIRGIIRADRQECLKNYGQRFITLYRKW